MVDHELKLGTVNNIKRICTSTVTFWPPDVVLIAEWLYRLYQTPGGKYPFVEFAPLLSTGVISSASPVAQERSFLSFWEHYCISKPE